LDEEFKAHEAVKSAIHNKLINSAHDLSDGGLFMALLESAMVNNLGFEIAADKTIRKDAFLFGEAQGRVLVSLSTNNIAAFEAELKKLAVSFTRLGEVKGESVVIDNKSYGTVSEFKTSYETSIESYMN
jgi:phosphoribosylformylglycinamidine synthase subunit PurL